VGDTADTPTMKDNPEFSVKKNPSSDESRGEKGVHWGEVGEIKEREGFSRGGVKERGG